MLDTLASTSIRLFETPIAPLADAGSKYAVPALPLRPGTESKRSLALFPKIRGTNFTIKPSSGIILAGSLTVNAQS